MRSRSLRHIGSHSFWGKTGDYAHKEPGDVHMERGGPEGALVLFNLRAIDNSLAESLSRDGTIIGESKFDEILNRRRAGN